MKVGKYCTRETIFVRSNETPLDAALVMREKNVGCVVIVDDIKGKLVPVGILTDRDITIEIVAEEVNPLDVTVGDLVYKPIICVNQQDDLSESLKVMSQQGVRRIPVVDNEGTLVGVLAMDDCLEIMAEQFNYLVALFKKETKNEHSKLAAVS
jgi:predicted transcriptional regulator